MGRKLRLWATLLAAGSASLWLGAYQSPAVVLAGFIVLFVVIRGVAFEDLVALGLGTIAAFFILPVSLLGALAAFSLVQILHELQKKGDRPSRDRFRDSLRTAERVLEEM